MDFKYVVDPSADEPIMLISGDIGAPGIDGAKFQAELLQLDTLSKKRIQVYINSNGGIVTDGMVIYNAITRSKTKVDTYNCGLAASIAAVIFQAGRKRIMADYSILMFHAPYYVGDGDTAGLAAFNNAIATMIARSGMNKVAVTKLLSKGDTFLDADQSLQLGLCDQVDNSGELNRPHGNAVNAMANGRHYINKHALPQYRGIGHTISIMAKIAAKHKQI